MSKVALQPGLVIASHGRHVWVETPDGRRLICHPRGKKSQCVVGDQVLWLASEDEGTIEKIVPRRNLFYRQDEIRTKSFAANIDLVLVLLGAEPEFSDSQLARALIAAEAEKIPTLIVINKRDLLPPFARAWARLEPIRAMGYPVLATALKAETPSAPLQNVAVAGAGTPPPPAADHEALRSYLEGKTTLVLGPSGAGKSTLINRLVPDAHAATNIISEALNTGKHTTTSTRLYWTGPERTTAVIDSPGFQEFGLHHIDPAHLASLMPDIRAHAQECRFYNCSHIHEPGCGVRAVLEAAPQEGGIHPNRYRIYCELFAELSQTRY